MSSLKKEFIPKEISWLAFNDRVLMEAQDPSVPILERIKFMGIYANNLDEFFRVRVAFLRRVIKMNGSAKEMLGGSPKSILSEVRDRVTKQSNALHTIHKELFKELESHSVYMKNSKNISESQIDFCREYFKNEIRQNIFPIMVSKPSEIPEIDDGFAYFIIELITVDDKTEVAVMKIPSNKIPRFIEIPSDDKQQCNLIMVDDIIRIELPEIFRHLELKSYSAYSIKLTKDAELDIGEDVSEAYSKLVSKSLKERKVGDPIRFEYDKKMPEYLLDWFKERYKLTELELIMPRGRYRNYRDYLNFPKLNIKNGYYKPLLTSNVKGLSDKGSILEQVQKQDYLLHFPFHTFDTFVNMLREASIDRNVKEIKVTLYRVSKNSAVANALINASRNGKDVYVNLELQARFDEKNNLYWSNKMCENGIHVSHGISGLKVHAKICYIKAIENNKVKSWAVIGTGNFNENTSKVYTDMMLLTSEPTIVKDIKKVFDFLSYNYLRQHLTDIILSPYSLRKKVTSLIKREIEFAKEGKSSKIEIKLNQLVDNKISKLIYKAAESGVKVKLIIRGMCSIAVEESKNLTIKRIVDRSLEHSRFYIFNNGGNPEYYISSADWMVRNLDKRVEVTCPIKDEALQKQLRDIFNIYWKDCGKAVFVEPTQSNIKVKPNSGESKFYSQLELGKYLNSF